MSPGNLVIQRALLDAMADEVEKSDVHAGIKLLAGANTFHYIIGTFIALGLVIRARRAEVDPTLEKWRIRVAASWFTWIAVSGVICATVLSLA